MECPNPHERCRQGQRCIVPRRHPQFSILCQYGGTRRRWQDRKGKALATPPPLLTFDPDLCDVLAEDHFDAESDEEHAAKGEPLTPFEGTEDKTRYYTPEPDQEPTFWDNVLPRYVSPTPPPQQQQQQQPTWWETDPSEWTPLDQIPVDWGGTQGLAGSMGAPSYEGGNVTPSGEAGQ